ncbi:MAG: GNAT family N-acetyltransferase [Myxococcota bacterium]
MRDARANELDRVAALWTAITEHHAALDPFFTQRRDARAERELRALLAALHRDPDARILVYERAAIAGGAAAARDAVGGDAPPAAGRAIDLPGLCIVRVDRAPPILQETERGEITDVGVREDARRQGIARALVDAALDWLRERGVARVEIQVAVGNREGQAFWRAMGFGDLMDVLHKRI